MLQKYQSPSLLEEIIASENKSAENNERIKYTILETNDGGAAECCDKSDSMDHILPRASTSENPKSSVMPDLINTHRSPLMIRPLPSVAPNKTSRKRKTQEQRS